LITFFKRLTAMSDCSDDCHDADFLPRPDIKQLPTVVQGRVKALKNLQLNTIKAEADYYREVHQLDIKYQAKYDEINRRRAKVIDGSHEPSGAEVEWTSDAEEEDVEADLCKKVEELGLHPDYPEDVKGLPKFWLHVFKNANEESLMGFVEPHDEEVLSYMTDLTVAMKTDGFTLHFHFKENPFFTNQELTKDYTFRDGPDPKALLEYDGPEIVGCTGCHIDWKEGKDVTKMTMKVKKIGKKGDRSSPAKDCPDSPAKDVTEKVVTDSFFDFFDPPVVEEDCEEDSTEDRAALALDFDVGFAIKEKLIPRAVLYFTGEIFDDEDDFEDCDTDEEEGDGVIETGEV